MGPATRHFWLGAAFACSSCANLSGLTGGSGDVAKDAAKDEARDAAKGEAGDAANDTASNAGDAALGPVAVLFGGSQWNSDTGGVSDKGDTWTWNGNAWVEITTNKQPAPRDSAVMATLGGKVYLFGGEDGTTTYNDTWRFDETGWALVNDGLGVAPSPRGQAAFAVLGNGLVVFGGFDGMYNRNDTWRFDGTTWTELKADTSPSVRQGASMVAWNGQAVLFGGYQTLTGMDVDDTWVWDGSTWAEQQPAHSPSARSGAGFATLGDTTSPILFGGLDDGGMSAFGDTWTWNGTDWTALQPGTSPPARGSASMASFQSGVLLFGGYYFDSASGNITDLGDTWLWDGTNWNLEMASGPATRDSAAMASQ